MKPVAPVTRTVSLPGMRCRSGSFSRARESDAAPSVLAGEPTVPTRVSVGEPAGRPSVSPRSASGQPASDSSVRDWSMAWVTAS